MIGTNFKILLLLFGLSVDSNPSQISTELTDFELNAAHIRHARLKCQRHFPRADLVNYTDDTVETQCFLHCFLYRMGLIDLSTRGLNSKKFLDSWDKIQGVSEEDSCLERFDFAEPLNGTCSDSYRKLMELRYNCLHLFRYIFSTNNTWISEDSKRSKKIGQSATEFCDLIDMEDIGAKENSRDEEVSLLTQYKDKLKCIFENIHYLDAYGRVDEFEINYSYQEAQEDSLESRALIRSCSHRANSKFQPDYLGNVVLELQKCLKAQSAVFDKVFKLRDETSRQY